MTASPSTTVAGTSGVSWQTGAHRVHVDLELHLPEIQRRRMEADDALLRRQLGLAPRAARAVHCR